MERLIQRAASLMLFMSEEDAASSLMASGMGSGVRVTDAFLAVKAAGVLLSPYKYKAPKANYSVSAGVRR